MNLQHADLSLKEEKNLYTTGYRRDNYPREVDPLSLEEAFPAIRQLRNNKALG